jgi:hypothetical protein
MFILSSMEDPKEIGGRKSGEKETKREMGHRKHEAEKIGKNLGGEEKSGRERGKREKGKGKRDEDTYRPAVLNPKSP